jgi:hypothetical protein
MVSFIIPLLSLWFSCDLPESPIGRNAYSRAFLSGRVDPKFVAGLDEKCVIPLATKQAQASADRFLYVSKPALMLYLADLELDGKANRHQVPRREGRPGIYLGRLDPDTPDAIATEAAQR